MSGYSRDHCNACKKKLLNLDTVNPFICNDCYHVLMKEEHEKMARIKKSETTGDYRESG